MQKQIVFLHGWGMNQAVWKPVIEALQAEWSTSAFNISALDLPGYGEFSADPSSDDLEQACISLHSQIPDNAVLVGWSLGGLFALTLAQQLPTKVKRVVLVASSPKFSALDDWPGIDPKVLMQFMTQLQRSQQKTQERFLAIQALGSPNAKQDIKDLKVLLASYPEASLSTLSAGLNWLKVVDLRQLVADLSIPIHAIFGEKDTLVPQQVSEHLKSLNRRIQVETLAKAAHAPFISHKQTFINSLKKILNN